MAHTGGHDSDGESDTSMPELEPMEAAVADEGPAQAAPPAVEEAVIRARRRKEGLPEEEEVAQQPEKSGVEDSVQLRIVHHDTGEDEDWEPEEKGPDLTLLQPCDEDYCEQELGYPKWPKEMKDPKYFRKELERMRTDPRYNKNLGRAAKDQEFWNEAARAPWAKVLLRKEQHWTDRRNVWLEQYNTVNKANRAREYMGEMLEDCPIDIKRLVAPIAKYKIVENLLMNVYQEAEETGVPFDELMRRPETLSELHCARKRLDEGGDAEAQRLLDEMDNMVKRAEEEIAEERKREEKERGRVVIDMQGLKIALDFGQKCKKDGLVEWDRGNYEEAIASWRQGDETLKKFRAPKNAVSENMLLIDLHSAVLKNLAQAAIKLEHWGEAAEAADRVLAMNCDDHKAWFRKACALEGMGNFQDARLCLDRIEEIAVGRPDRDRLVKDCQGKREKFQAAEERHCAEQQRMLKRGLRRGIFSIDREASNAEQKEDASTQGGAVGSSAEPSPAPLAAEAQRPAAEGGAGSSKAQPQEAAESAQAPQPKERMRITRDGAWDLLDDLEEAYKDPWFVKRVDKLIVDVMFDPRRFTQLLGPVALDAQRPVLEKWGFEPSAEGLQEMRLALRDHTRGPNKDIKLRERAEAVHKALHGSPHLNMYERVMVGA